MTKSDREVRLIETFVGLIADHKKEFESFVRDIENVRYSHTPIDGQQLARCEYALRNMGIRLLTINDCINSRVYAGATLDELVKTKNAWTDMKMRVDSYLNELHQIIANVSHVLAPVREAVQ